MENKDCCTHLEKESNKKFEILKLILAFCIFGIAFFCETLNCHAFFTFLLFLIAFLICGCEVIFGTFQSIFHGDFFDEKMLMTVASITAFFLHKQEEAFAVMFLYNLGEFLQDFSVEKSHKNIEKLMDLRPDFAMVKCGEKIEKKLPAEVKKGETIVVRAGERIALDGKITFGTAFVDEIAISGESVPKRKNVGDFVYAGSIVKNAVLEICVTKNFSESAIAKIIFLVEKAAEKKAKSEKFITKFSKIYTPIVFFTAFFVALIPPLLGHGTFSEWIYKALSFLIIACPCALIISVPLTFFAGIGLAAKNAILLKGANLFEKIRKMTVLVFDKTGTLSTGKFGVNEIFCEKNVTEKELLQILFDIEKNSIHPIAKAIVEKCHEMGICKTESNFEITEIAGKGLIAKNAEFEILAGNQKLMSNIEGFVPKDTEKTCVYLAKNKKFLGCVLISDSIRPFVQKILKNLRHDGIKKIFMLSGDSQKIVDAVGKELGIDEVFANLLPEDKLNCLEKIMSKNVTCGFVGDGINDAPVLMRSDIGIAMGKIGSDIAIDAADMVIMNDDINQIFIARQIAKKTQNIVKENIAFTLFVKFSVMIFAVFFTVPIYLSVFADVGVALLTVANSMRLIFSHSHGKQFN